MERVQAQGNVMHSLGAETQAHRATLSTLAQQLSKPVVMERDEPTRGSTPEYTTASTSTMTSTGTVPENKGPVRKLFFTGASKAKFASYPKIHMITTEETPKGEDEQPKRKIFFTGPGAQKFPQK